MDEWSPHSRFIHSRFARSSKAIVIKASDVAVTCACRDLQIGILLKLSVVHCISARAEFDTRDTRKGYHMQLCIRFTNLSLFSQVFMKCTQGVYLDAKTYTP